MSPTSARAGLRLLASVARQSESSGASQSLSSRCASPSRVVRSSASVRATFSTVSRRLEQSPLPTPPADRASTNVQRVQNELSPSAESTPTRSLIGGLGDPLPDLFSSSEGSEQVDWTRSYHGLSSTPFTPEQAAILMEPLSFDDIEIKPDGIVYLPEIKYRRILNRAFGPGGWGLAPRGETIVTGKVVTREYGLVCGGRLVSIARGEQQYFDPDGIPTATEGCKSNAMMRCCKDLGIASELWDPRFIKRFLAEMGRETMVEHQTTKRRRKHFMRKDDEVRWPLKDVGTGAATPAAAPAPAARAAATASKPAAAAARTFTPRPAAAAAAKR